MRIFLLYPNNRLFKHILKEKPQKKESTVVEEVPVIPVKNKVEDHNGFKIAPFISPVFGIERPDLEIRQLDKEETIENPKLKPEKTIDVSSLNQQTKESDDFLKSLKDLRKNLD